MHVILHLSCNYVIACISLTSKDAVTQHCGATSSVDEARLSILVKKSEFQSNKLKTFFFCLECRLTELEEERLQILSQLEQESKAKENAEAKARNLYNDLQSLQEQAQKTINIFDGLTFTACNSILTL
jgi:multidrug efflux pump subunit AcrA (membrane-fusion protein)